DGDRGEFRLTARDHPEDGRSFRADGRAVARVFHVAADVHVAELGEDRGAHPELRIGCVSVRVRGSSRFDEVTELRILHQVAPGPFSSASLPARWTQRVSTASKAY